MRKHTKDKKLGKKISEKVKKIRNKIKPDEYNSFSIPEVIMLVVISILFGVIVGCILTYSKTLGKGNYTNEENRLISTFEKIRDNYYEEVSEEDLTDAAIDGMLNSLDDPYSYYMDSTTTTDFKQRIDGSYIGVGITVLHCEGGDNSVTEIFENSPAAKAGVKVGDIFLSIDGKEVRTISLEEISKAIEGKEGASSEFVFLRDEKEVKIKITRGLVEIPSVTSKVIKQDNKNIGYVYIETFAANTYAQFSKKLVALEKKNIDSLIIDVRSNPGGHLSQVQSILSMFFDKKTILYQVETKGNIEKFYANTKDKRNYDVVVLIDSSSASASEILAACFKDNYKNVTLVGTKSYGKGTIQKTYEFSNGSSLKYTAQKWLTSKGKSIDGEGIEPDVVVELNDEYYNNPTDENDLQLQKAIEILKNK